MTSRRSDIKPAAYPAAPPAGGERRHLALLFMDMSGSSRLAEALEAEHFAEILTALRDICRTVVLRHGGRIARIQGDGALALFGYPTPREDDGRRAVEAALEVHARFGQVEVAGLPASLTPLQMHSGVHSGLVLVSGGDVERGRFELVGDAPNTAARLAAMAPPGVVLVDVEALGPHAHFFELEPAGALKLPGRSTPVTAARVHGKGDVLRRFDATSRRGLTPFIGRRGPLGAVAHLLQVPGGATPPHRVYICGEAGIGKTRLLEEMAQLAAPSGFLCLRGYCESYLGAEVLQPFKQMARAGPALRSAGPSPAVHKHPGSAAELLDALGPLVTERPVLLLLDDWQWADDASRQLLETLLKLARRMLVVLATRPLLDGAEAPVGSTRFDLTPFNKAQTGRTVMRWLPGANPFVVTEIHHYAGGVPLFVEELCHSASSLGNWRPDREKSNRSAWLTTLVASRLDRLELRQRQVMRVAAVLGVRFPIALLLHVGNWQAGELDLAGLAEADFLYPVDGGERLRFKHGLTRDAVYETVGLRERVALHLQVVSVLAKQAGAASGEETLEALAYHTRAAGLGADAALYAEQAGDKAASVFALDRARAQYLSAMESLDSRGEMSRDEVMRWCYLVHKLGMTFIFDALALPDALPVFERCLALSRELGDAAITARSQYWLAYVLYGAGYPRKAAVLCREALSSATLVMDARLVVQVEATLGQVLTAICDYDEALVLMNRAVAAKRHSARSGSGVAVGSAFTLACKGSVLGDRGEFEAAHESLDEAMALVGASTHPVANSVRNWAVMVLLWQGRWGEARAVAEESASLAESSRALLPLAISRAAGGYAQWMGEGSTAGFEQIEEAVRWMEQRHGRFYTSIYYGWLVEGCVQLGQHRQARAHAARLLLRARAGEVLGEGMGCRSLSLDSAAAGKWEFAERYWQRAEASAARRASRREHALNRWCRARLLERAGRATEAARFRQAAVEDFLAMGMTWHAAEAAR